MKKLIVGLLSVAAVTAALSQGNVTFNTYNTDPALGKVFLPDGVTGPGPSFFGQLYWSDTSDGSFEAAGSPVAFGAGSEAFYVLDGDVVIPGRDAGVGVWFSMYVWDGPSFASPLTAFGITEPKLCTLAGIDGLGNVFGPVSYNNFVNLSLRVPEPGVITLGGLGLASLLIFRRRK